MVARGREGGGGGGGGAVGEAGRGGGGGRCWGWVSEQAPPPPRLLTMDVWAEGGAMGPGGPALQNMSHSGRRCLKRVLARTAREHSFRGCSGPQQSREVLRPIISCKWWAIDAEQRSACPPAPRPPPPVRNALRRGGVVWGGGLTGAGGRTCGFGAGAVCPLVAWMGIPAYHRRHLRVRGFSHANPRAVWREINKSRTMGRWGRAGRAPKDCVPKWPDQIVPVVNFAFPRDGHFGLEGRGVWHKALVVGFVSLWRRLLASEGGGGGSSWGVRPF